MTKYTATIDQAKAELFRWPTDSQAPEATLEMFVEYPNSLGGLVVVVSKPYLLGNSDKRLSSAQTPAIDLSHGEPAVVTNTLEVYRAFIHTEGTHNPFTQSLQPFTEPDQLSDGSNWFLSVNDVRLGELA